MKKDIKPSLINYGFSTMQADTLIKTGILKTGHGTYKLNGDKLTLKKPSDELEKVYML